MAQVDYFLKIEGVEAESTDEKHKGEIELESFSWGQSNSGTAGKGGGSGAGKVVAQDLHFVKKLVKKAVHYAVYYTLVGARTLAARSRRITRKAVYQFLMFTHRTGLR